MRRHGLHTLIGMAWIGLVWWLDARFVPWLLPVAGALMLSIPLSVLSSRVGPGKALRRCGLFLIPEETHPVPVLEATQRHLASAPPPCDVLTAVVDPGVNALVCAYGVARTLNASGRLTRRRVVQHALHDGLSALDAAERRWLVSDPVALSVLHEAFWQRESAHLTPHPPRAEPSVYQPARGAPRRPAFVGRPAAVPLRHTGA